MRVGVFRSRSRVEGGGAGLRGYRLFLECEGGIFSTQESAGGQGVSGVSICCWNVGGGFDPGVGWRVRVWARGLAFVAGM